MKKILLALFILGTLMNTGCKKCHDDDAMITCRLSGTHSGNMQVLKDCTGVYLRYQQKDYRVCNEELLANYKTNDRVISSFTTISDCFNAPQPVCNMWHQHEGFIEVTCVQ